MGKLTPSLSLALPLLIENYHLVLDWHSYGDGVTGSDDGSGYGDTVTNTRGNNTVPFGYKHGSGMGAGTGARADGAGRSYGTAPA